MRMIDSLQNKTYDLYANWLKLYCPSNATQLRVFRVMLEKNKIDHNEFVKIGKLYNFKGSSDHNTKYNVAATT